MKRNGSTNSKKYRTFFEIHRGGIISEEEERHKQAGTWLRFHSLGNGWFLVTCEPTWLVQLPSIHHVLLQFAFVPDTSLSCQRAEYQSVQVFLSRERERGELWLGHSKTVSSLFFFIIHNNKTSTTIQPS